MRLGKPGIAGSRPDEFNAPSAVLVAPNGDIFVADGHGGNTNARIVKFDKAGKFIKTWAGRAAHPARWISCTRWRWIRAVGCSLAIAVTTASGYSIRMAISSIRMQFSSPSGVYIDKNDVIYVADAGSGSVDKSHGDCYR